MKAIQIEAFGRPAEVLKAVDIPDVGAPAAGEVVIALEASPINQYDLLMIAGGYGYRPRLPAIMGTEGVGRVVAVGAGVKHLKEGDRALVPFLHPAWAERIKNSAPWLRPLPPGDINQFAMMGVNPPTAYFLLTDIVTWIRTRIDGVRWGIRPVGLPFVGVKVLHFRLMVDVVCVEQPQASWEERSMKHYAGLDVSVKETSMSR
jgi:NADPH:quinone reductase-like Zn-dependent oxidoreductase